MGGDNATSLLSHQLPHQGQRALLLVDGVGPFENLIQDDEQALSLLQPLDNHLESFQLCEEIGFVAGQGVGGA